MKSYAWPTCLYVETLSWTHVVQAVHSHSLDASWEGEDASFSGRRRFVEERPKALVNATMDSVNPQLGTILTECYENYIRDKDASSGLSVPEVEEYIAVDILFTSIIDNAQAKKVLSTVIVQVVDFMECFARVRAKQLIKSTSTLAVRKTSSARSVG
jgi:hypothetical protein